MWCDLERQVKALGLILSDKQQSCLRQVRQLLAQTRNSKNKLYSLHQQGQSPQALRVWRQSQYCGHRQEVLIVVARSYPGNPYDGHTLADLLQ